MPRQKLSTRSLTALKSQAEREGRPLLQWDTETKGFGVRVSPKGEASWLVQKWIGGRGGKAQRYTFKAPNIDDARKEAERLIGDVRSGIDLPNRRREKRKAKRAALNASTLNDAVDLYLKLEANGHRESYWSEVRRKFEVEIIGTKPRKDGSKPPVLGKGMRLPEITKADIRALIDAKASAGQDGAARYLFAVLRPFFEWCVDRDLIVKSPLDDMTPPRTLASRDRVLSDDEIKAFWNATLEEPLFGPFYRLLLLTAQRRDEVAGIDWSEINGTEWSIPKERTKNGLVHLVPLTAQASGVLNGLRRKDKGLIFTTTGETAISGYGKAKDRLDKAMEIVTDPDAKSFDPAKLWRVHDLRRTAATTMGKLGIQPHVIEAVLNHVSGSKKGVAGVYNRYQYFPEKQQALDLWATYIVTLVGGGKKAATSLCTTKGTLP